jgi:hypothetical protein
MKLLALCSDMMPDTFRKSYKLSQLNASSLFEGTSLPLADTFTKSIKQIPS